MMLKQIKIDINFIFNLNLSSSFFFFLYKSKLINTKYKYISKIYKTSSKEMFLKVAKLPCWCIWRR